MKIYRIALIPGDGIGREVVPAAVKVLKAAARDFTLDFREFEWGCEYYLRAGHMMPEDGLAQLRPHDAILLGAVGLGAIGLGATGTSESCVTPSSRPAPGHASAWPAPPSQTPCSTPWCCGMKSCAKSRPTTPTSAYPTTTWTRSRPA